MFKYFKKETANLIKLFAAVAVVFAIVSLFNSLYWWAAGLFGVVAVLVTIFGFVFDMPRIKDEE